MENEQIIARFLALRPTGYGSGDGSGDGYSYGGGEAIRQLAESYGIKID